MTYITRMTYITYINHSFSKYIKQLIKNFLQFFVKYIKMPSGNYQKKKRL